MNNGAFFAAERGVILVGQLPVWDQAEASRAIREISQKTGWPIFADALSGLRGMEGVIQHADGILHHMQDMDVERVLHFGESYVSKRISEWLRPVEGDAYWQVHLHSQMRDPFFQNPTVVHVGISEFAETVPGCERLGDWLKKWQAADTEVEAICREMIDGVISEPAVSRIVARQATAAGILILGNSMPVRDFDAFAQVAGELRVLGNRGASGIDGNVATAAGAAFGLGRVVIAVVGDLTALHDLNSLALLNRASVILVVINNGGGGIFRFLPLGVSGEELARFWETAHGWNFQGAAAQFGLPWTGVESAGEFERELGDAIREGRSCIFEVRTDREENLKLHRAFGERVRDLGLSRRVE